MAIETPEGKTSYLYEDMLSQMHLLVAGAAGSGKSVLVNGLISTALYRFPYDFDGHAQFILIDPKRVELVAYKNLPHTLYYASEPADMRKALKLAMALIDKRYEVMQKQGVKKYGGSDVYIIIDEFADLMTTDKKHVAPLVQRICQVGRAAKVHMILCTQCPLAEIIPTKIKCNFDAVVGLRTRSAQDSRNIIGMSGLEQLPRYGKGIYITPESVSRTLIPMVPDDETERLINHWENQFRGK